MGSVWAFLEEGHLLRHFWLAKGSGSVFLFQCLKMSCLGSHLGIVLWANWNLKRHQGQLERENTSWTAQELSASKAIWIQTFYSAHCRAKAFRLELTFFFYVEICATSSSHWKESCPHTSACRAGEPGFYVGLLWAKESPGWSPPTLIHLHALLLGSQPAAVFKWSRSSRVCC